MKNKINEESLFVNLSTKMEEAMNMTFIPNLYQFNFVSCLKWFLRKNTMNNLQKNLIILETVTKLTGLFWKHSLIPPLLKENWELEQAP